jgi:hypothetical protein
VVSWRAIFLINVPLALATVLIALRHVPESGDPAASAAGLDWTGALLATAGLGAVAYGLTEAPGRGFGHPLVWGCSPAVSRLWRGSSSRRRAGRRR